jgi:hypothetical protein
VFVAKFFGRAGLMGFITAVPEIQRPALFQSLLYEACGRTVNPVFGAVGLLWAGNWQVCQAAVETVLKGGSLKAPSPSFTTLPQGPLHPSTNPGKDMISKAALIPSVINETDLLKAKVAGSQSFQRASVYERKPERASWDSFQGNVVVNSHHVMAWPHETKLKVGEKRDRDLGPAVVVPAARRVKPMKDTRFVYHHEDEEETVVGSTEHLDLGLTLTVKDGKGGQITGLKRVYSPSCDSVNSEGSVTSLDTTPRHGSFSSQGFGHGGHHMMSRKLLPLLL